MQKVNKLKRKCLKIPEGTKIHSFLFEDNNNNHAKWELLEQLISQLPKSKAERAVDTLDTAFDEIGQMYPGSKDNLNMLKQYILKQLLGIELTELGFKQVRKTRLEDEYFEMLKKA